jgi:DNA processing protein
MQYSTEQRKLLALCALKVSGESWDWSHIAREASVEGGVDRMLQGVFLERSDKAPELLPPTPPAIDEIESAYRRVDDELLIAEKMGAQLVTVLDENYPQNLRLISNLPPFLFVRGELRADDALSVAVVGTRQATEAGLRRSARMATALVEQGVTVISGLARGIDTAAHTATLDAGGRTVAVIGTGIKNCYPPENHDLAERIVENGAVVSQFWPSTGSAKWTFPRRNVVMSGISQGSVVIEASSTSGAKMQARLALEHGKRVFLVKSLVTDQPWAKKYVATRGAIEVTDVEDVIRYLASPERIALVTQLRQQLSFENL